MIDNYDSFVFNLVQYLGELGAEPVVHRNDALTVDEALAPGARRRAALTRPGTSRERRDHLRRDRSPFADRGTPVLGVCLGHQAIGHVYGATVVGAPTLMHGKTSEITHDGDGVFAGLPSAAHGDPLPLADAAARLAARRAWRSPPTADDGTIMGVRHRELPTSRACSSTPRASSPRRSRPAAQLPRPLFTRRHRLGVTP